MTHHDPDDPSAPDAPRDAPLDADLRALLAHADAAPTLRPSRDLWPEIAARLDAHRTAGDETRMLVFRPRADADAAPARPLQRRWLAAAAVALVALSSGATYLATRPANARTGDALASASPPPAAVASADVPDAATRAPATAPAPSVEADVPRSTRRAPSVLRAVSRAADTGVPGEADYDREIAALRAVVLDGRSDLDSATVDVLARNLRIIDAAIAASRAALARDPRSPFLGEQLTRALGQKVDLLRTAALLPHT